MKAFQLKIAIKNSKPPIWRRVIVPSGITFSQLSMILNEVMGWCGYHMFEFEFYHKEIRLVENVEDLNAGYDTFDYLEASENFIREYLEENDWFTYTYDLGDDWQHRVTIEKIIEDYEYSYPQVIKYKGDCPVEDCGGIYGYYDCLDIISDENNPEYEERLEWLESQGYPNEYDMQEVNQTLKEQYFYKFGKADKRYQSEIYEEHFAGVYGLKATKSDKNKNAIRKVSEKHKIEESMQMFADAMKIKMEWEKKLKRQSLQDILTDYEKKDLVEIAKEKGVKGISGLNKEKLVKKLVEYMLNPQVIKEYFLCLTDDETAEFEKACKAEGLYSAGDAGLLMKLYESSYIGMLPDGRIMIPKEVRESYFSIKSKEFDEERKMTSYLLCCLNASESLYGIVPMEIFEKLLSQNISKPLEVIMIKQLITKIPIEINSCIVVGEKIYAKDLYPDDRGLLSVQGNKKYYLPTLKEIIDFGTKGYDTDSKPAKKLKQFILNKTDAMPDEADFATHVAQIKISEGCDMQEIFEIFEELEITLDNEKDINRLVQCISELWNNTRMVTNRGFTPNELSREKREYLHPIANGSNIINFPVEKPKKIYPNDPCPCGSGKKYKNCCKNKEEL